jgi:uracil-DNA glycosylase family protein
LKKITPVPASRRATPPRPAPAGPAAVEAAAGSAADLAQLRARALSCRGCPLYRRATQTVFGEGPERPRLILVGEQPGDREDRSGRPFVGPAGGLLGRALAEAGLRREQVYLTNAVKHFKWVRVGKRRIHQKPGAREIAACRPWLERELDLLGRPVVVALGATAAQTLMGPAFRVTQERGREIAVPWARAFFATVHPSAILRGPPEERAARFARLVMDLRLAAERA